jgi:hypothetical protein
MAREKETEGKRERVITHTDHHLSPLMIDPLSPTGHRLVNEDIVIAQEKLCYRVTSEEV